MTPRHEAEITEQSWRNCLRIFRHPSEAPTLIRNSFTNTRDYYAGRDVVDLERAELIKIISWTRRMGLKMTGSALFLGLLVCLALVTSCKADVWTPDDFDWDALQVAPEHQFKGLYLNLTENPVPEHSELMSLGEAGEIDGHRVLFITFSFGLAFQVLKGVVGAASFALAVKGCVTNDGSAEEIIECVLGLAGTAFSLGTAFKAAKNAGWFARASNTWSNSGLENIALDVFQKRDLDQQAEHEATIRHVLRSTFGSDPVFMGYVHESHRLGKRDADGDHLHPLAPIYRFAHPKRGLVDVASREHADNSTRMTFSYANHGLEKRQSFQHERLSDHVFEGRFDGDAARADPGGDVSFDASGGYQQIEDGVKCFVGGSWPEGKALSAQFYDTVNKGTFGFASLGVFENHDNDGDLQAFSPSGMPLPQPSC